MSENRLDAAFAKLKSAQQKALIGYVMAGHPTKENFRTIVLALEKAGLDCLEVGVPFSDPIADGPVIQEAGQIALAQKVSLNWVLSEITELRKQTQIPIVLMTYLNPLLRKGIECFCKDASAAGVDGLIIPDMIPEEAEQFELHCKKNGIDLIFLAAPTTPFSRLKMIGKRTRGFLYAVSLTGVTGARAALSLGLPQFLNQLRATTSFPVCVGFGISTPEHVREVSPYADGIIVGSALVRALGESQTSEFKNAVQFVKELKDALLTDET